MCGYAKSQIWNPSQNPEEFEKKDANKHAPEYVTIYDMDFDRDAIPVYDWTKMRSLFLVRQLNMLTLVAIIHLRASCRVMGRRFIQLVSAPNYPLPDATRIRCLT